MLYYAKIEKIYCWPITASFNFGSIHPEDWGRRRLPICRGTRGCDSFQLAPNAVVHHLLRPKFFSVLSILYCNIPSLISSGRHLPTKSESAYQSAFSLPHSCYEISNRKCMFLYTWCSLITCSIALNGATTDK